VKNRIIALIEEKQIEQVKTFTLKDEKSDEKKTAKREIAEFQIGDTVDVHQRILEGAKERVQIFSGTVIARHGAGLNETFTVRRIVQSEGVERIFPLQSPKIAKLEVKRTGTVRRAKLYYLRDRVGKATKLRERKVKEAPSANGEAAKPGAKKPAAKKS
jgi:large subunit ribosomal protein L19